MAAANIVALLAQIRAAMPAAQAVAYMREICAADSVHANGRTTRLLMGCADAAAPDCYQK